jgi:hypothetical protein
VILQDGGMDLAGVGWLPWRYAVVAAVILLVLMLVARSVPRLRSSARVLGEVALILGLYAAWQYAGSLSVGGFEEADDAGLFLASLQEWLRWPSEAALQAQVLGNDALVAAADSFYAGVHAPVFVITLVWVLALHRRDWPFVRTTVVLTTAMCLLIQFKPVAPPRLLPQLGIVDTALENGRSVYAAIPGANQFSAMPSVHIAWAAAVALIIIICARTPWRWLAVAYPLTTLWVVVVTGNHFLIDGVVAVALLGLSVAITLGFPSQRPERLVHAFGAPVESEAEADALLR